MVWMKIMNFEPWIKHNNNKNTHNTLNPNANRDVGRIGSFGVLIKK